MEPINFTAAKIRLIEKEAKKPFLELVGSLDLENISLFLKAGFNLKNQEEVDAKIDKYLEDKEKDITTLFFEILEALRESGFLPKALDINKVQNQMKEKLGQNISINNGSEVK